MLRRPQTGKAIELDMKRKGMVVIRVSIGLDLHGSEHRSCTKQNVEETSDRKGDRVGHEEERDGSDKSQYRSSKPRKYSNAEEAEEWDNNERRKSSEDRTESRKRSGGSTSVGSGDENEYGRKEIHSKQAKKNLREKKLSRGYQEGERESSRKGRDLSGSKGHRTADESETESSRKSGSNPPVNGSSQSKSRSKMDSSHDFEQEKIKDRKSRYAERKENSKEKIMDLLIQRKTRREDGNSLTQSEREKKLIMLLKHFPGVGEFLI